MHAARAKQEFVFVEFARALVSLFRNVPYLHLAGVKIVSNMVIVGVLLNAVRYIEIAFYQPASVASIISGLSPYTPVFFSARKSIVLLMTETCTPEMERGLNV